MIDRYYFVKLTDEHATAAGRAEVIARCRAALAGVAVTAGVPADDSASRWDVGIVVRVADLGALAALLARPEVAAFMDWLAARSTVVKAWSFEEA